MKQLLFLFVLLLVMNGASVFAVEPIDIEYSDELPDEKRAELIYGEVEDAYKIGLKMPKMGSADRIEAMYIYQGAADILSDRTESLPLEYIGLKSAINSLRMCVSMLPSDSCEMVKLGLDEAKPVIFPESSQDSS